MIKVEHLSKSFGPKRAVDDVSFEVAPGQVLGFLGPNGAGKSTTMRMITGFIAPTSGKVTVCGFDIEAQPLEAKRRIGYLPEAAPSYPEMTVSSFLNWAAEMRGLAGDARKRAVAGAVETCFLQSVLHQTIDTLSKGFRRRVGLAQAIVHDPELLVLDEPLKPRPGAALAAEMSWHGAYSPVSGTIVQAGIQGTFDLRCLYRGGFRLPHEQSPAGVMPFHLLMKGEIRVSTAQGDDVVLRPGDLLLLPGGEPHTIWREGDTLTLAASGDGLLPLRGDGGDQVEFLCGEYRYQGPLRPLLLDALPSPLCIPLLASESQQALSLVLSLIHQELLREQQGSGAVLTALSQVLLAMGLRAHASDPHGALGLVGALQDPRLGGSLQAMLADPAGDWVPRTVIFAGKSASAYFMAKLIIRLINDVAAVVNADADPSAGILDIARERQSATSLESRARQTNIAVLIGATVVFFLFPRHQDELAMVERFSVSNLMDEVIAEGCTPWRNADRVAWIAATLAAAGSA